MVSAAPNAGRHGGGATFRITSLPREETLEALGYCRGWHTCPLGKPGNLPSVTVSSERKRLGKASGSRDSVSIQLLKYQQLDEIAHHPEQMPICILVLGIRKSTRCVGQGVRYITNPCKL